MESEHNTDISNSKIKDFAPVVIRLLQGSLNDTDKVWKDLLAYFRPIHEYFAQIGLEVVVNEKDGYAYLSQPEQPEDSKIKVPRLIARHKLSYEVSLLLVILREWLEELDASESEANRLFVTNKEIKDRIELFFKERTNRSSLIRKLDEYINKVKEMGFLQLIRENKISTDDTQYEVKRIIKAKINNDKLHEILARLSKHVDTI